MGGEASHHCDPYYNSHHRCVYCLVTPGWSTTNGLYSNGLVLTGAAGKSSYLNSMDG